MSDYIFDTEKVVEFEGSHESICYNGNEDKRILLLHMEKNRQSNCYSNGLIDNSSHGLPDDLRFRDFGRHSPSQFHLNGRTNMKAMKVESSAYISERPEIVFRDRSTCDIGQKSEFPCDNRFTQQLQPIIDFRANEYKRSFYEYGTKVPCAGRTTSAPLSAVTQNVHYLGNNSIDVANTSVGFCENYPTEKRFVMAGEAMANERERRRKEKHNKLERTRRTFINDKIAELGNLLPENVDRPLWQRKGKILKETVDYVKKLKLDLQQMKQLEGRISEHDIELRKISVRLERIESMQAPNSSDWPEQTENDTTYHEAAFDGYQFEAQVTNKVISTKGAIVPCSNIFPRFLKQEDLGDEFKMLSLTPADDASCSSKFDDALSNYF